MSFARENITTRSYTKSAMIDTTSYTSTNGSGPHIHIKNSEEFAEWQWGY